MAWPEAAVAEARWQTVLRRRFDRAAHAYQALAQAQRASADELLMSLRGEALRGTLLDVGCGTGHLARALAAEPGVTDVLAVDLSEGMLRAGDWRDGCDQVVPMLLCADAVNLPLASASVDVLVSNFALHWCPQPLLVLRELRRVLRADGCARLVIPVAGSLSGRSERAAEGAALRPMVDWREAALVAGWQCHGDDLADYVEHHADADAWLATLRAMGVTARRETGQGLAGRAALAALRERLESTRTPAGIPLRYKVWRATLRPA